MKLEDLSFVNRQLAEMLKSGIPLEPALAQLCRGMRRGKLRRELELLEADLAKGVALNDALARRRVPELYKRMVQVGVASNDLPGALLMLADYYHQSSSIWVRLKTLLVYPTIVLLGSFLLSIWLAVMWTSVLQKGGFSIGVEELDRAESAMKVALTGALWMTPLVLGFLTVAVLMTLSLRGLRARLRWKLSPFKEASLAQIASAMAMMLRKGTPLDRAFELIRGMEAASPMRNEIERWQTRLAGGQGSFAELTHGGKTLPPLFIWIVTGSGGDWASGFSQAAELYASRARSRAELMLHGVLPAATITLGLLIILQLLPTVLLLKSSMSIFGDSTFSIGDAGD